MCELSPLDKTGDTFKVHVVTITNSDNGTKIVYSDNGFDYENKRFTSISPTWN